MRNGPAFLQGSIGSADPARRLVDTILPLESLTRESASPRPRRASRPAKFAASTLVRSSAWAAVSALIVSWRDVPPESPPLSKTIGDDSRRNAVASRRRPPIIGLVQPQGERLPSVSPVRITVN